MKLLFAGSSWHLGGNIESRLAAPIHGRKLRRLEAVSLGDQECEKNVGATPGTGIGAGPPLHRMPVVAREVALTEAASNDGVSALRPTAKPPARVTNHANRVGRIATIPQTVSIYAYSYDTARCFSVAVISITTPHFCRPPSASDNPVALIWSARRSLEECSWRFASGPCSLRASKYSPRGTGIGKSPRECSAAGCFPIRVPEATQAL